MRSTAAATTTARNEGTTTRRSTTVIANFTGMAVATSSALLRHIEADDEVRRWCEAMIRW